MPAAWNPPNRFDPTEIVWEEAPPPASLQVVADDTRDILSHNHSPDIPFSWSVNPYRGCTHACAYCYARPTHEYLALGAGTDFERVIHVKTRAGELLRAALTKPSWSGEPIAFAGVTDAWQPLERKYRLTPACLQACAEVNQPVLCITRSPLVVRDADLLGGLAKIGAASVTISLPILEPAIQRALEPGAPPPSARLRAIQALAAAGVPVGVSVSPIIPGLNDRMIPDILRATRDAGATFAFWIQLRLPGAVAAVFEKRLREQLPDRADAVLARIRRARGGSLNDPRFGSRMRGSDEPSRLIGDVFRLWHDRLGFGPAPELGRTFRRPAPPPPVAPAAASGQLTLFGRG
jgi:DNA repair photolyase